MSFGDPFRVTCVDCGNQYYTGDRSIARYRDGWRCKPCGVKLLQALIAMSDYLGIEVDEEDRKASTQLRLDGR